ncbi:glycogen synthase GlgA [Mesobacillus sp. AQ2]|uniref:glycogen synthase GlgA n=1 Tax=Mesobacillus sp. AQ2 TaxID=3043332 RepID=UPI0024C10C8D|nr:glycogen synthase GlgA [Mesobacillus sp. AQ2]WHX39736.1 glycogen synthase GlgA [Mesobacillus sp. AQ2]
MKVLFAVSECVPFIKSGGLADVAGSLPKELKKLGTDVRVILPKYGLIPEKFRSEMKKVKEFTVQLGWRSQYCGIEALEHDGVTFYFVDNEYYFKRDSLYGHYDDGERFSFFSRAVLEFIAESEFYPDVIHCHDWHTGMIPFLLRTEYYKRPGYGLIRSVFTIHNLQFQGIFPREVLGDLLQIDSSYFNEEQLEFYGMANFMKAALISSDYITTVSPTYKDEIQTEYFGEKLDGILRKRNEDLSGIVNGIDHDAYDPESDPGLAANFGVWGLERRVINKLQVQRSFGLSVNDDVPVVAMITRLTKQKGLDLVREVFHEIMATGVQLVVLGTGDPEFEQFFREMAAEYPDQCGVYIGFDENLAHQVYAGSDLFLMPSKFEPCGLSQMIAMRYGSIPIVRETGGLNDTVQPYNEFTGEGNGFTFANFNAHDMLFTIERSLSFYRKREKWLKLMAQAMETDYSWAQSARQYKDLYSDLISRSESHVF